MAHSSSQGAGVMDALQRSEMRAHRREIEKQSRLRREKNLRAMRDQVATLQQVLRCLGLEAAAAAAGPLLLPEPEDELTSNEENDGDDEQQQEESRLRKFLRRSMALVSESKLLRDERFRLITQVGKKQLFEASIRTAVAARRADLGEDEDGQNESPQHQTTPQQAWGAAVTSALFEPWSATDVAAHVRDSLDAIRQFATNPDPTTSKIEFMGWEESRRLDPRTGRLQFSFSKTFAHTNAAQLFEMFWEMQFSADKLRRHNLGLNTKVRVEVVQHVSRDVAIQRRDVQYSGAATRSHTVLLLFRQKTPTGFMACMRTVEAPAIQRALLDDPESAWVSHFHWTHIDTAPDEPTSCRLSFCGSLATKNAAIAHRWMLEIAFMLVRGETTMVGPRQLTMY